MPVASCYLQRWWCFPGHGPREVPVDRSEPCMGEVESPHLQGQWPHSDSCQHSSQHSSGPGCLMGPLTHVPFSGHRDPTTGFTRARLSPAKAVRKETAVLLLTSGEPDCAPSNVFSKLSLSPVGQEGGCSLCSSHLCENRLDLNSLLH